ncbi:MAG: hypothetical protein M1828_002887 [Chrysothrix sp. TS-e1954]|nr:MAG: hypothetical protein M1828_002887 [Chrysothrix sp. TS-e1954]
MCDISAHFLSDLAVFSRSVQDLPNIELPPTASGRVIVADDALQRSSISSDVFERDSLGSSTEIASTSGPTRSLDITPSINQRSESGLHIGNDRPLSASLDDNATSRPSALVSEHGRSESRLVDRIERSTNLDARPSSSRSGILTEERSKSRQKAKQEIVLGSLYLHAGRWADALRELVDGTQRARTFGDHVWYAKGLEVCLVTMLLLAWGRIDFTIPPVCRSTLDRSATNKGIPLGGWVRPSNAIEAHQESRHRLLADFSNMLPHLLNQIADTYQRNAECNGGELPHLVVSECIIRLAKVLASLHRAGTSLNDEFLDGFVRARLHRIKDQSLEQMPFVTRTEVCVFVFRAYPSNVVKAGSDIFDVVTILTGIISVLTLARLHRKRAVIVREMLGLLLPQLIQARKVGAAEAGIHPAASLAALHGLGVDPVMSPATSSDSAIQQGFHDVLTSLCDSFRVAGAAKLKTSNSFAVPEVNLPEATEADQYPQSPYALADQLLERCSGGFRLKTDILRLCANFSEALPSFADVVRFSVMLLSSATIGGAPKRIGSQPMVLLDHDDQLRCSTKINRTFATVRAEDVAQFETAYWDDFLVRDIFLARRSEADKLLRFSKSYLQRRQTNDLSKTFTGGPFIHSSLKSSDLAKNDHSVVRVGTESMITILLQNLYDFDVIIEELTLVIEGVPTDRHAISAVLGPCRLQEASIPVTARATGDLLISGCSIKIQGCHRRNFVIFRKPYGPVARVKLKYFEQKSESARQQLSVKSEGLALAPVPESQEVILKVVPLQPCLEIVYHTLPQEIISVAHGESKTFTVSVCNTGETQVDLLRLSYDIGDAQKSDIILNNTDIAGHADLTAPAAKAEAFKWRDQPVDGKVMIPVGGRISFTVDVVGSYGSKQNTLHIDYASSHNAEQNEDNVELYGKRLSLPFQVTVEASITLQRFNILPLPDQHQNDHQALHDKFACQGETAFNQYYSPRDSCLLLFDFVNVRQHPLYLDLEYHPTKDDDANPDAHISTKKDPSVMLRPREAGRVLLPIEKLETLLNDCCSSSAALQHPSSQSQKALQLKNSLLQRLSGSWVESYSGIRGTLDLSGIMLGEGMTRTLVADPLRIDLDVVSSHDGINLGEVSDRTFLVTTGRSFLLRATIHNRTEMVIQPLVSFQHLIDHNTPDMPELGQAVILDGLLRKPWPIVQPSQPSHIEFQLTIVSPGRFEINVTAKNMLMSALLPDSHQRSGDDVGEDGSQAAHLHNSLETPVEKNQDPRAVSSMTDEVLGTRNCILIARDPH